MTRREDWRRTRRTAAAMVAVVVTLGGDDPPAPGPPAPAPSSSAAAVGGLSPELAARVIARVGDRAITLGEYAAVLDRMDRFERLRYQTDDRRKALLDEMINVELLAREAERRGLHERPEAKELERQLLRDELLRQLRAKLPSLDELPVSDVQKYYADHRADFKEPERRRVAHIVVASEAKARTVLEQAKSADPKKWGALVSEHSIDAATARSAGVPPELAGDLGMVTPPSFGKTDNPRVPEAVRAAAFEIDDLGGVHGELVRDGERFHVVRLIGKSAARDRTFAEAERTIRVKLLRQRVERAEADLEAALRKKYPVVVDEAALARVPVPDVGGDK